MFAKVFETLPNFMIKLSSAQRFVRHLAKVCSSIWQNSGKRCQRFIYLLPKRSRLITLIRFCEILKSWTFLLPQVQITSIEWRRNRNWADTKNSSASHAIFSSLEHEQRRPLRTRIKKLRKLSTNELYVSFRIEREELRRVYSIGKRIAWN